MFDEFYVEEGYVEPGYFVYTANAETELEAVATKLTVLGRVGDFFVPMDLNAALTADTALLASGAGDLTATAAVTAQAEITRSSSAQLNSEFDTLIEGVRTRTADINTVSIFTLSGDAKLIKQTSVDLDCEFSITAETDRLTQTAVDLDSEFLLSADADQFFGETAFLTATADLDSDLDRFRTASINSTVASGLSVFGTITHQSTIDLTTDFSVEIQPGFVKQTIAELAAETILSSIVIVDGFPTRPGLNTEVDFAGAADLNATSDLSTVATLIAERSAELPAIATKLIAAGRIGDFFVNSDSNATLSAQGAVTRSVSADLVSDGSVSAQGERTRNTQAEMLAQSSVSSIAERIFAGEAILISDSAISNSITRIRPLQSSFSVVVALTGDLGQLDITQYIYRIPRENRTVNILKENRTIQVRR